MTGSPDVLRVEVASAPEPGLLRPAVEAAVLRAPWPAGPEADVGRAVADAVARALEQGRGEGVAG